MPSANRHNLVIPPDLWREVEKRTPPGFGGESETVSTMLRRYIALLAESRTRNRTTFTPDELQYLRMALEGASTGLSIEDALTVYADDRVLVSSGIDVDALMERVATLSPTDKIGLVDSVERARLQEQARKRIIVTPHHAEKEPSPYMKPPGPKHVE